MAKRGNADAATPSHRWMFVLGMICFLPYLFILLTINCSISSPSSQFYLRRDTILIGYLVVGFVMTLELFSLSIFFLFLFKRQQIHFGTFLVFFLSVFALLTPSSYCAYDLDPSPAIRSALRNLTSNSNLTSSGSDVIGDAHEHDDDGISVPADSIPDITANLLGRVSETEMRHKRPPLHGLVRIPRGIVLTAFNHSASRGWMNDRTTLTVAPLVDLSQILIDSTTTNSSRNQPLHPTNWGGLTPVEASARWNRSQPIGVWAIATARGIYGVGRTTDSWFDDEATFAFMQIRGSRSFVQDAINEAAERYGLVTESKYVAIVEWDTEESFRDSKQNRLFLFAVATGAAVSVWMICLWIGIGAACVGGCEARLESEKLLRSRLAAESRMGRYRDYQSMRNP